MYFIVKMSPKSDVLLQIYAKSPAPLRDYYGITISNDQVVLNIWNISYGPHVYPKKFTKEFSEILDDKELQYHIGNTFGAHVREYVIGLARKEYNLHYLPTKIFLKILNLLAARDILNLSQTSKIFFEICNNDKVWKIICRKHMKQEFSKLNLLKAEGISWKQYTTDCLVKQRNNAVTLNNCSSSKVRNTNINIIRNIESKNPIKRNQKVSKVFPKADSITDIIGIQKNKNNEQNNLKLNSNSKSAIALDKNKIVNDTKKLEDKKIRSVTDILSVVSTVRTKSSANIKNKNIKIQTNK